MSHATACPRFLRKEDKISNVQGCSHFEIRLVEKSIGTLWSFLGVLVVQIVVLVMQKIIPVVFHYFLRDAEQTAVVIASDSTITPQIRRL